MNWRLIIRAEAEIDILDAALWYDNRARGLGLELMSEVQSAIARVLKNPDASTRVRINPVVLHAARHDRVWKHRVENE